MKVKKVSSVFTLFVYFCVWLSIVALETSLFNIGDLNFYIDTSKNGICYFFQVFIFVIPLFPFFLFPLFHACKSTYHDKQYMKLKLRTREMYYVYYVYFFFPSSPFFPLLSLNPFFLPLFLRFGSPRICYVLKTFPSSLEKILCGNTQRIYTPRCKTGGGSHKLSKLPKKVNNVFKRPLSY